MKLIRTPDEHYFEGGYVKFSTGRPDGELHYEIHKWSGNMTSIIDLETGKVKDEAHLKELQSVTSNNINILVTSNDRHGKREENNVL